MLSRAFSKAARIEVASGKASLMNASVATPEGRPVRRRRNHNRPIVAEIGNEGARMARSGAFSARPSNDRENPSIMGLACGDRRSMSNRALGRLCDGTKFSGLTGECYDLGPFFCRSLGTRCIPTISP